MRQPRRDLLELNLDFGIGWLSGEQCRDRCGGEAGKGETHLISSLICRPYEFRIGHRRVRSVKG